MNVNVQTLQSSNTTKSRRNDQDEVEIYRRMSEERSKGISLRKKRTVKPPKGGAPTISAPRQISAPMPTGLAAATLSSSGRPSNESTRSGKRLDAPRPRPGADKTADLVKRRYSQRITQLPSDFGNGAPMPDMPQIPSKFREAPPSRDGRPQTSGDGRGIKIDPRALQDENLQVDRCMCCFRRVSLGRA